MFHAISKSTSRRRRAARAAAHGYGSLGRLQHIHAPGRPYPCDATGWRPPATGPKRREPDTPGTPNGPGINQDRHPSPPRTGVRQPRNHPPRRYATAGSRRKDSICVRDRGDTARPTGGRVYSCPDLPPMQIQCRPEKRRPAPAHSRIAEMHSKTGTNAIRVARLRRPRRTRWAPSGRPPAAAWCRRRTRRCPTMHERCGAVSQLQCSVSISQCDYLDCSWFFLRYGERLLRLPSIRRSTASCMNCSVACK